MHDAHYSGVEMEMHRPRPEDPYAHTEYGRRAHRGGYGLGDRSTYSETDYSDVPESSRHYEGRGGHARGDYCYGDDVGEEEYYGGPSMPRGYGARGGRARGDEYEDGDEDDGVDDRGRRIERSRWL